MPLTSKLAQDGKTADAAREQLQTYLWNKEAKGASLESLKTNTTVGLIDSIAVGCNGKVLSAQFGIAGIPHYVLIDKKGNIAQKYAPRPSEREILLRTVDELLNK